MLELTICVEGHLVNVFSLASQEAGERLSGARRRSVLAELSGREGDLVETGLK